MSVNIKLNSGPKKNPWDSIKNGDFAVLEGTEEHPIREGLYRLFIIHGELSDIFIIPMFDGPFEDNMFPYLISEPFPILKQKISNINIEAETSD